MGQSISTLDTEVAIIGAGPGGYIAAIRLADLGKEVTIIEERHQPGGTCLLEGCIPSKTLINAVELSESAKNAHKIGLEYSDVKIDLDKLRHWTETIVDDLSKGIGNLLKHRKVNIIHGHAHFINNKCLEVEGNPVNRVTYKHCIIATGSKISQLPAAYQKPVWTSAEALKIPAIPKTLLVVGGGYIGLEMGLVYSGLGSKVTVAEFSPQLLQGADQDLVNIMLRRVKRQFSDILVESTVVGIEKVANGFKIDIQQGEKTFTRQFNQVLVAVGRSPNTDNLGLHNTKIGLDSQGLIDVNSHCLTDEPNIYAVGDVAPGPMLAHKASREGKIVAELITGEYSDLKSYTIPFCVFTDPEIAWTGLTEKEANEIGIEINIGKFPLRALGRARTLGRTEGMVKIISDPDTQKILGVGMVGPQASELISEATLALQMGATLKDLMITVHPHPTISEAILEAAEVAAGTPIHIFPKNNQRR
jgi:dihydrolipoamide dehydrogenase